MDLVEHPFFSELAPEDRTLLVSATRVRQIPPEVVIFDEQAPSDGIFLVLKGTIAISRKQPDGTRRFVNYAKSGSSFGELGVLLNRTRSARATSLTKANYAVIPLEAIKPMIASMPSILRVLIKIIGKHLSDTTENYLTDLGHQENLATLGTLINSVLHDFKNPLTLVTLNSQILAQLHPDSRTKELCRNIEAQVERMAGMAAEIGEFSRSGEKNTFTKVNLKELAETFHFLNAPLFAQGTPSLEIDVEPVEFEGEPRKLLRVLQNIVGNGVEALSGIPNGKIKIYGNKSPDGQSVVIRISDNGPGIPVSVQKRFWEPFFTHGKAKGTGLGSSIAKAMIDAHGGTIRFSSSPETGTTFYIALPVRQDVSRAEAGRHLLNAFRLAQTQPPPEATK